MLAVSSQQISLFTEAQILELVRPYEDNVAVVSEKMASVLCSGGHITHANVKRWMNSAFGGSQEPRRLATPA